jgi:hypothetical protein
VLYIKTVVSKKVLDKNKPGEGGVMIKGVIHRIL